MFAIFIFVFFLLLCDAILHFYSIPNAELVRARLCRLQKMVTRLAAGSEKVYQSLARRRWFSPGTTASFTTTICRHDIAEILLKVELNTINQSIKIFLMINYIYELNER